MLADVPGHHEVAAGNYIVRATAADDIDESACAYLAAYPPDVGAVDLPAARLAMDETFRGEYGEFRLAASPVAVIGDRIAAVVQVVTRAPWPGTPACPFAVEVFTHPAHRRVGLARALLSSSMRVLAEHGHGHLALRVVADNFRHGGFSRALGSDRGVELQAPGQLHRC
jgi:GNAT superfamily N-acetyltransferase